MVMSAIVAPFNSYLCPTSTSSPENENFMVGLNGGSNCQFTGTRASSVVIRPRCVAFAGSKKQLNLIYPPSINPAIYVLYAFAWLCVVVSMVSAF